VELGERGLGKNTVGLESLGAYVGMPHSDVNTGPFPAVEHAEIRSVRALWPCAIPALSETGYSSYEVGNVETELRARGLTTILSARTQRARAIGHHQE
jgi:hypothetical protein